MGQCENGLLPCSLKGVYEGDRDRMMLASVVIEGEVHMQDVVMFHDRMSSNHGRLIADGGMLKEVQSTLGEVVPTFDIQQLTVGGSAIGENVAGGRYGTFTVFLLCFLRIFRAHIIDRRSPSRMVILG